MHRLYLLGRVDLIDPQGVEVRSVLSQPRRLALLAYLAASPRGAARRDRLLGLFWPELEQEHARKALNKSVHFLRQELGDDVIVSRGAEDLALDATRLWCDVSALTDAVAAGRNAEVVQLYRGDFLPSFYVEGAAEFDAWVESERGRLRRLAAGAASVLARERESHGQVTSAISLARLAADMSGDDERALRQLLELLDRLGDRAGALYTYEKFARRLAAELDATPSAETQALIERVRARDVGRAAIAVSREPVPPPPSLPPSASGQALADALRQRGYEIERELGRGGMATVYLARDVRHDRKVALKVLAGEVGQSRPHDRFDAEVRITARLQHPNIVPLFDSGSVDGLMFYTMAYVPGDTLRDRLTRERQLPVDDALKMLVAIADALSHAHVRGIVHRDIKPENILLHEGRPMLADFGIALALSNSGIERLTSTGMSLGTPQYMSPEQAAGELSVGPRSDVYSLAAVGYEMLAGEPPFTGPNTQAVLARVMLEPARSIRTIRGAVPPAIERAILTALAKHPADRFPSAAAFSEALQSAGHRVAAQHRRAKTTAVRAAFAVGLFAVTGLAFPQSRSAVVAAANRIIASASPTASGIAAGRIVVAPMQARTGDVLQDSVSDAMLEPLVSAIGNEGLDVLPAAITRQHAATLSRGVPAAMELARRAGAEVVVLITSHRRPAGVVNGAELLRMPGGRRIVAIDQTPARDLAVFTERVVVALRMNRESGQEFAWAGFTLPSKLASFEDMRRADELFARASVEEGLAAYRQAWAEDSSWFVPALAMANRLINVGRLPSADSAIGRLRARRSTMREGDRLFLEHLEARLAGDLEREYHVVSQLFARLPLTWAGPMGDAARRTRRIAESVRATDSLNVPSYWTAPARRVYWPHYWRVYGLHELGKDSQALAVAQDARLRFPNNPRVTLTLEIVARAGLRQVKEVERVLAETDGLQSDPMPAVWSYTRTVVAAQELEAHGETVAAQRLYDRAIAWHLEHTPPATATPEQKYWLMAAYYAAQRWPEAWALLNQLPATSPGDLRDRGVVLSHLGRRDSALAVSRSLAAMRRPYPTQNGIIAASRACIAAALGDKAQAVELMRQAFRLGASYDWANGHRDLCSASLRDYPSFRAFIRPR